MVVIHRNIYSEILKKIGEKTIESGGFLGCDKLMKISAFTFDDTGEENTYLPNENNLNNAIRKWNSEGIRFVGFIHSHLDRNRLSYADIEFAKEFISLNEIASI